MSWQASAHVAEIVEGISRSEKLVLMVLANRHNPDTGRCDAAVPRIARESLMSVRTCQASLSRLEEKGFVRIEKRPGFTNQYWLLGLATALDMGGGEHTRKPRTPAKTAEVTPANSAPPVVQVSHTTPAVSDGTPAVSRGTNRNIRTETLEPKQHVVRAIDPTLPFRNALEQRLPRNNYLQLFGTASFAFEEGAVTIRTPNAEWIENRCRTILDACGKQAAVQVKVVAA